MTRRPLAIVAGGALSLAAVARPAAGQSAPREVLTAVVVDASHRAVDAAEVFWLRDRDEVGVRTDSTGRFSFGSVAAGHYRVRMRRLGYQPRVATIDAIAPGARVPELMLATMPVGLEAIRVIARVNESQGKLAEFYQRRGRPNRLGYFFEEREFGKFEYLFVSDYLRTVPGVTLRRSERIGNLVRFRGCQPMVWLDGMRMDHAEADDLVLARDVAAMEVYVSPAGTPGQFRDISKPCGAIVIWKKL